MDGEVNRLWDRPVALGTGLVLLFALSFTVPIVLAMGMGGFFHGSERAGEVSEHFPAAVDISAQGTYLYVPHSEHLLPAEGKDFGFFFWVNLKRLPAAGQRLVLFSKFEAGSNALPQRGYAFALKREGEGVRPVVFWGDGVNGGRWWDFPEVQLTPKQWVLLGFELHDRRYLGAFVKEASGAEGARILGGYPLEAGSGTGMGDAGLVFGAFRDRPFRGAIGPLLVVGKHGLSDHLPQTLSEFAENPLQVPASLKDGDVKLWMPAGPKDESSHKAQVEVVKDR